MKESRRGAQMPRGERESKPMSNSPAPTDPVQAVHGDTSREHSETAAEGTDGLDMPEIRMHSQEAAEGPDDAG